MKLAEALEKNKPTSSKIYENIVAENENYQVTIVGYTVERIGIGSNDRDSHILIKNKKTGKQISTVYLDYTNDYSGESTNKSFNKKYMEYINGNSIVVNVGEKEAGPGAPRRKTMILDLETGDCLYPSDSKDPGYKVTNGYYDEDKSYIGGEYIKIEFIKTELLKRGLVVMDECTNGLFGLNSKKAAAVYNMKTREIFESDIGEAAIEGTLQPETINKVF